MNQFQNDTKAALRQKSGEICKKFVGSLENMLSTFEEQYPHDIFAKI
jgi:hypothetical protein